MKFSPYAMLVAAVLAVATPAISRAAVNSTDTVSSVPMTNDDDDDQDFPWGLLGLLGLAGLLGRKRDNDVRVNRTDNQNR